MPTARKLRLVFLAVGCASEFRHLLFKLFGRDSKLAVEHLNPEAKRDIRYYFGSNAGNAGPDRYLRMIKDYFGEPTSAEDLCVKGQLLSLESNKAMYEGWLDHIWNDASGILTWMGQSAYPSMVWQTYDYYYDLTGAYRLMLVDREKGGQILPAIFSDNYFTLRPGETKTVEIEVDSALLEKGYQVVAKTYQSK